MDTKQLILQELDNIPEFILEEVWDFLQFLKLKDQEGKVETTLLSESSLQKDWLSSEEGEAWKNL